jgi:predicted MFS family arabinose efflux permease
MTLATVIGMPLGTSIGQNFGWRASFIGIAVMAALAVGGIASALPKLMAPPPVSLRERLAVAARRDVLAILALTALSLSGAFALFTYIAPLLHDAAGFDSAILPVLLFAFGAAGAIGNVIAGYAADHWDLRAYVATLFAILALAFIALSTVVTSPVGPLTKPLVILCIGIWGVAGWGMPTAQQARLVERDPRHAPVLISLNASALYLGSALGAALGSLTIAYLSIAKLGFVAGLMEGIGLAVLVATASVTRRRELRVVRSSE